MMVSGPIMNAHGKEIINVAVKSRLPVIYERPNDVEFGGLTSYSTNIDDLFRRAAVYVDKILKGRTPTELPVE
jgi:putative tryptophan/tyrosine transport system substrate-binding protein